jgi:hypothetical protein
MKALNFKNIFSFLLFICSVYLYGQTSNSSQSYIKLIDVSGAVINTTQMTELQDAANEIISQLPSEFQSQFKVYDIGYYRLNQNMEGFSTNETWENCLAGTGNRNFLAFGRIINNDGSIKEIKVELKLPGTGVFQCISEKALVMKNQIGQILNSKEDPWKLQVEAMKKLAWYINTLKTCECVGGQNCFNSTFKGIDALLTGMQFRKKEIKLGINRNWINGDCGIFDYAGKEVIIDNNPYYIPDQVSTSKHQFDLPKTLVINNPETEEDTTLVKSALNGKVYILNDSSFNNGQWD